MLKLKNEVTNELNDNQLKERTLRNIGAFHCIEIRPCSDYHNIKVILHKLTAGIRSEEL